MKEMRNFLFLLGNSYQPETKSRLCNESILLSRLLLQSCRSCYYLTTESDIYNLWSSPFLVTGKMESRGKEWSDT